MVGELEREFAVKLVLENPMSEWEGKVRGYTRRVHDSTMRPTSIGCPKEYTPN